MNPSRSTACIPIGLLVVFTGWSLPAQAGDIEGLKGTGPDGRAKRQQAAEAIHTERQKLIKELIQLAGEKVQPLPGSNPKSPEYPWRDGKHLAILLLGDLRAPEAVPVLIDNIEYSNPREVLSSTLVDLNDGCPAVDALCKIGTPAVDPVIIKLGSYTKDCQGRINCCWVLEHVLGTRLAKASVQMAIQEATEEEVKQNLRAALVYFRTERDIVPLGGVRRELKEQKP